MAVVGAVAAVASVGVTAYGMNQSQKAAQANQEFNQQQADRNNALIDKQNAQAQEQIGIQNVIIGDEQKADDVRRQAMSLDAKRKSLETLRSGQQAYALSLSTGTAQGAQFGSGMAGGLAQTKGSTNSQLLGISQNLQSGNSIFDINQDISAQRIALGKAGYIEGTHGLVNTSGTQAALGAGLTSLGGTVLNALPTFGKLAQSFGGNNYTYDTNLSSYTDTSGVVVGNGSFGGYTP